MMWKEVIDFHHPVGDDQFGKWSWNTLNLFLQWIYVIRVNVTVAHCIYKVTRLEGKSLKLIQLLLKKKKKKKKKKKEI